MIRFADNLKISNEKLTTLLSDEFQLFLEIIHCFNFTEVADILNQDRLIQTIIIDHIEIENQIDTLDLFNDL